MVNFLFVSLLIFISVHRIPVLYVFGKEIIDINKFIEKICIKFKYTDKIIIFCDVYYQYVMYELENKCKEKGYENIIFSNINNVFQKPLIQKISSINSTNNIIKNKKKNKKNTNSNDINNLNHNNDNQNNEVNNNNQNNSIFINEFNNFNNFNEINHFNMKKEIFCGRTFSIPINESISSYFILYIGKDRITLNNLMIAYNQSKVIYFSKNLFFLLIF